MDLYQLYEWNHIAEHFKRGSIILGNGSSIAINPSFSYWSLYQNALQEEYINEQVQKIFKHLDTKDFELVLRMLWHTNTINTALNIEDNETTHVYKEVRSALIKSVENNHPDYQTIENYLPNIAKFLKKFKTVISLNYDLIVYWAINKSNNDNSESWFKDCWLHRVFDSDFERYRKPYNAQGATLVFYPHGNLILTTDLYGQEEKITANNKTNNLREEIINTWKTGNYLPLFVSEGTSEQKKKAIGRSYYLETVYNKVLKDTKENQNIVIFGWSMSDQDAHILEAIDQANPKKIAISIHVQDGYSEEKITKRCQYYKDIISKCEYKHLSSIDDENIYFFDSSSPGFWINDNTDQK